MFARRWRRAGLIDKRLRRFGQAFDAGGLNCARGKILDAHDWSVPKQRTPRRRTSDQAGKTPEGWEEAGPPRMPRRTRTRVDEEERNDESFYGYKSQLGVDKAHS